MSLRQAPTSAPCCADDAPPTSDAAAGVTKLLELPSALPTDCRYNSYIGTRMPCGAIVSYGSGTYAAGYVCTTKSMASLDPAGNKLYRLSPETMTKGMMAVQTAMNGVAGAMMYGNVYGYMAGVHTYDLVHMDEIAYMNAAHYPHNNGKMGKMFAKVHAVLETEYPMGYTYTTFRKVRSYGSY